MFNDSSIVTTNNSSTLRDLGTSHKSEEPSWKQNYMAPMGKRDAFLSYSVSPFPFESNYDPDFPHVGFINSGDQVDFDPDYQRAMMRLTKRALEDRREQKRTKNYMARTGKRSGDTDTKRAEKTYMMRVGKRTVNEEIQSYTSRFGKRGGQERRM